MKMMKQLGYARMKIERRARWDPLWRPVDTVLQKIETMYWCVRGNTVIECFGDSHVKIMRRLNWMFPNISTRFRTISVMGATAYGLSNYKSVTSSREIYEKRLNSLPRKHQVLVLLGEIDTNFLIWSLAEKNKLSVEEVLEETVKRYMEFLVYIKSMGKELFVCSSPLPTTDDGIVEPVYLAIRGSVKVSKKDRTAMALEFNSRICRYCESIDATYIDLDSLSIDAATGLLKKELISSTGLDHHYEENAFAEMLLKKMASMNIVKKLL